MLGNTVEQALRLVGVTQQRVEYWLGTPCNCPERIAKLNQIGAWAWRIVEGRTENALHYLDLIIGAKDQ